MGLTRSCNNFKIKFFDASYIWEGSSDTEEYFADDVAEVLGGSVGGPGFSFVFTNQKQETIWCYFQSWLLWEMDEFIEKIKSNKFAFQFMEPFTCVKMLVWPLPNDHLRITMQNCSEHTDYYPGDDINKIDFKNGPRYEFLEVILDLEVDKKQFITAFERAMTQARDTLKRLITNYIKNNNLSEEKFHYIAGKMGLEPKIED